MTVYTFQTNSNREGLGTFSKEGAPLEYGDYKGFVGSSFRIIRERNLQLTPQGVVESVMRGCSMLACISVVLTLPVCSIVMLLLLLLLLLPATDHNFCKNKIKN